MKNSLKSIGKHSAAPNASLSELPTPPAHISHSKLLINRFNRVSGYFINFIRSLFRIYAYAYILGDA